MEESEELKNNSNFDFLDNFSDTESYVNDLDNNEKAKFDFEKYLLDNNKEHFSPMKMKKEIFNSEKELATYQDIFDYDDHFNNKNDDSCQFIKEDRTNKLKSGYVVNQQSFDSYKVINKKKTSFTQDLVSAFNKNKEFRPCVKNNQSDRRQSTQAGSSKNTITFSMNCNTPQTKDSNSNFHNVIEEEVVNTESNETPSSGNNQQKIKIDEPVLHENKEENLVESISQLKLKKENSHDLNYKVKNDNKTLSIIQQPPLQQQTIMQPPISQQHFHIQPDLQIPYFMPYQQISYPNQIPNHFYAQYYQNPYMIYPPAYIYNPIQQPQITNYKPTISKQSNDFLKNDGRSNLSEEESIDFIEKLDNSGNFINYLFSESGCKDIQRKLSKMTFPVAEILLSKVLKYNSIVKMMTDSFANYLFQKAIELISSELRCYIIINFSEYASKIGVHNYGTHSIQLIVNNCSKVPYETDLVLSVINKCYKVFCFNQNSIHIILKAISNINEMKRISLNNLLLSILNDLINDQQGVCIVSFNI